MHIAKPYFVMIHDQHGSAMIMTDGDKDDYVPAFFAKRDDAAHAGDENMLARACGFEIFKLGDGEECL